MASIGKLEFDDGVLKASSPNLPPLAYPRPADLAESRLMCDPPVDSLDLPDGAALLDAAFRTIPFVREPYPIPAYGLGVTEPARAAFDLFLGRNAHEAADSFRVLRGEVDDFVVCARRWHDVWKVGAFTVKPTTLTLRFEDLWSQLPKRSQFHLYLAEIFREPNAKESGGPVRETIPDVAPDARFTLDLPAGGGFTVTFWPVAAGS